MNKAIILTIAPEDWQRIKGVVLDQDGEEALRLLKAMIKQIELQEAKGLKSHLG